MKNSNIIQVGILSALMSGCASTNLGNNIYGGFKKVGDGVSGTWNRTVNSPDKNSTPAQKFCHDAVSNNINWEEVVIDTAKGAGAGAIIGGTASIFTEKNDGVSKIFSFGGAGAAISGTKTLLETNSNYDRQMDECLDYTKKHPQSIPDQYTNEPQ